MKRTFNMIKKNGVYVSVGVIASAAATQAMAELPAGATTAFTDVQTDALALVDLAWPAVIAVTTGFIILKLFKKAANKVG